MLPFLSEDTHRLLPLLQIQTYSHRPLFSFLLVHIEFKCSGRESRERNLAISFAQKYFCCRQVELHVSAFYRISGTVNGLYLYFHNHGLSFSRN